MTQLLNALPGALAQGLIWGVMAIGVYITYKVLDIADLTVDGSICTGAAVCTMLLLGGQSPWLALLCAVLAGVLAGAVTGLLHVGLGIPPILAGILTQMVLWSVNLKLLGKANQALPARTTPVLLSQMDVGGALTLLMATLQKPKLLLLDEHTAALDPQTAQRVMDITDRLVRENHLTTLMITHNMRDAIHYGNRLLMLHNGRIVLDISGEEKARLTVPDLLALFSKVSGQEYDNDRALLALFSKVSGQEYDNDRALLA